MIEAVTAAALAGLVGSPHCLGMCGAFALACGGRVAHTAAWHAGKITTYALLGFLAGGVGSALPGPPWIATLVSGALVVWFAAALAGLTPEPAARIPGLAAVAARAAKRDDIPARFLFGMANGLLPCGLVYAALGIAVASGDPVTGAAAMAAFGLGTLPALAVLGLGLRRAVDARPAARRVLAVLVLVSGLWIVARRHAMQGGGAHAPDVPHQTAPHEGGAGGPGGQ